MEEDKELFKQIDDILKESELDNVNNNNGPINTNPRPKKGIFKWIIIVFIIIIIIATVLYKAATTEMQKAIEVEEQEYEEYLDKYSEEFNSYHDYKETVKKEEFKPLKENIMINAFVGRDEKLICELFNANNENVKDLELYVIYYDSENNPVAIEDTNVDLIYAQNYSYCDFNIDPDYNTYDFLLTKGYETQTEIIALEEIKMDIKDDTEDNVIAVNLENNSNKKMDSIEICMVCYDEEGKITSIDRRYGFEIKAGEKEKMQFYYYDEEMFDYKIVVNNAYNYMYNQ